MWTLAIFPEGGLASSVITTVWVGVWVLCLFNLRFGWVLSGLVVPGYLVPLIIVKPISALVIVIEAILSYVLVYLFSEKISRGRFPSLFGRDRFMGLILASIAVRLVLDGFLLPPAAEWLSEHWNREVHWQSDLQSFGLVIISLLANQFWKPGLRRGLFAMVVGVGLTWFIVRYGLMEWTNFHIGGVTYLYEGLASSVLASPKAYIILVLTALYASHMNVRYGWDFSGILIPALIALQWYEPTKILTSFIEAIVIFVIARRLMKLPWLAAVTMEGANKILLFFNVSFALKLIVGWALLWAGWNVKTTDFYGFGYLLSTLIAMKAHDKDIFPRLMRSTLQVSFVGAGVGNLVGFALALVLPAGLAGAREATDSGETQVREDALLVDAVGDAHWRSLTSGDGDLSAPGERGLADALDLLSAGMPAVQVGAVAASGGWRVEVLGPARAALVRADGSGRDLILFDGAAPNSLALRVSDASAPGLAGAGRALMARLGARWLVVTAPGGAGSLGNGVDEIFARRMREVTQIRLVTGERARLALSGDAARRIPIDDLRAAAPGLNIAFATTREADDASELTLPPTLLPALWPVPAPATAQPSAPGEACRWPVLVRGASRIATREPLLFLREEVVVPLLAALDAGTAPDLARRNAALQGLALTSCRIGTTAFYQLSRPGGGDGIYLFALSGDPALIVEGAVRRERKGRAGAPPVADRSLEVAALRLALAGRARVVALAERELDYDGSQATAFGIVTQTALARLGSAPALAIQLRPRPQFGPRSGAANEAILLPDRLGTDAATLASWQALARRAGYAPVVATRARAFAGYEAFPLASLRVLNQSFGKRYLIVYPPDLAP